jgi:NAD-dependent DNA ligase
MKINLPNECPSCGSDNLELEKDLLYCRNKACSAQSSGKLQKFCKVLKIKGFGPATIEKSGITSISELVNINSLRLKDKGFSDKMAYKLAEAVGDRLGQGITVSDFLAAVSIPNIGTGTASKLNSSDIDDITFTTCKNAGLGDVAANSFMTWKETEWQELSKLNLIITKPTETKPNVTAAIKGAVCITGKLNDFSSRSKAAAYLQEHGYEVKSSVTKNVHYLICEDGKETSSSYKKAIAAGIPVITIKQLLEEN